MSVVGRFDVSDGETLRDTLGGRESPTQRLQVLRQVEENSAVAQNCEIWPSVVLSSLKSSQEPVFPKYTKSARESSHAYSLQVSHVLGQCDSASAKEHKFRFTTDEQLMGSSPMVTLRSASTQMAGVVDG